jgi:ubiquinone/menaquinone biosynthesis C-methylase UbiE
MKPGSLVHAPDPVGDYFAGKAGEYQSKSARFPWAWVRTQELAAVRALLGSVTDADVLELGAGTGYYTQALIESGARHVWAVDMSAAMLARLPAGSITPVLGDAAAIRLDRRFPILVSSGMLEFVQDPEAVLANAARHAEPGALLMVLVPRRSLFGHLYRRFHRGHGFDIHFSLAVRLTRQ